MNERDIEREISLAWLNATESSAQIVKGLWVGEKAMRAASPSYLDGIDAAHQLLHGAADEFRKKHAEKFGDS